MLKFRQPEYVREFRCLGADCPDTCCEGWGIAVDRDTYFKYQNHADPAARERLSGLVTIHSAGTGYGDFARIRLNETRCPAIREGLCSVQQDFGEPYLPDMCSVYPRVFNAAAGTIEQSLNLSCPEAARLALTKPGSMCFEDLEGTPDSYRSGSVSLIPQAGVKEVRERAIRILQDRSLPLWRRLVALGDAIEEITGTASSEASEASELGPFDRHDLQLEVVLELIIARISSDYTSPRFLRCYAEFMRGLQWDASSTMEDLAHRYRLAFFASWLPFAVQHECLLENYLVNYAFRSAFPFGRRGADQTLTIRTDGEAMRDEYRQLVAQYAMVRTLLVGMAGLHGAAFQIDHAILLIQSFTKSFQHSGSFPATIAEMLGGRGLGSARELTLLIAD